MKSKSAFRLVRNGSRLLAISLASLLAAQTARSATIYWDGTGTDWSAVGSWDTDPGGGVGDPAAIPGAADTVDFSVSSVTTAQTVNLNANQSAAGLVFLGSNTAATSLLGGGYNRTLTLGTGGITVSGTAGAVTIGSATVGQGVVITLSGAQAWTNDSSNPLTIQNGVTNGGNLLTVNGSGNTVINGAIGNGAGGLTKSGSGMLTLTGSNTYSGATTVSTGVLNIQNGIALGTTGAATTVAAGAALQIQGNIVTLNEGLTLNGTGIATDGALRNVSGVNVYTGALALAGGPVRINSDAGMLINNSAGSTISSAFALTVGGAGNVSFQNVGLAIGANALTKDGSGTLGLFGNNSGTYTGGTNINGGTLLLGVATPFGATGSISFGGGTLQYSLQNNTDYSSRFSTTASQPISIDTNNRSVTFASNLTSSGGSLTKLGTGTLTLSGTGNTYGNTTINNGTLLLSGAVAPGTGTVAVNSGGTLSLADATARSTSVGGLTLASGTLQFDWLASGTVVDTLSTGAAAVASGNVGIMLSATTPTATGGNLITAASGLNGAKYFLANNTSYTATLDSTTAPGTIVSVKDYVAAPVLTSFFWKSGMVTAATNAMAFSDGTGALNQSNWVASSGGSTATSVVPGATATITFDNTGVGNQSGVVLGADMSVLGVTFNDASGTPTIASGNTLTIGTSGIAATKSGTINAGVFLGGNQNWNPASGQTLTLGGQVSGTGNLTVNSTPVGGVGGVVTMTGASTFSGATSITGGTLNYASGSSKVYQGSGSTLTLSNGGSSVLNVAGDLDVDSLSVAGVLNLSAGSLVVRSAPPNGDAAFNVGNGGYGMLNISGGVLTGLGGTNNFYGNFNMANGSGPGLLRVTGGVFNMGQLMINRNGGGTAELTITNGTISKAWSGGTGVFDILDRGAGTSVINVAGGLIDNTSQTITLGRQGGTAGSSLAVVNFDAGTMVTKEFSGAQGSTQYIVNFNGGTVKASPGIGTSFTPAAGAAGSLMTYVNGAFGSYNGGIVMDTNGSSTTLNSNLLAPTGNGVTSLSVNSGGSGYNGAPYVTLTDSGTTQPGTTALTSNTIAMASTTGVFVGQSIAGTGIPNGSIVTAVTPNTSITISQNATAAGSPTLTFKGQGATAYANVSGGVVTDFVVTNPGVGYIGTVTAALNGGLATGGSAATLNAITPTANTSGGLVKNGEGTLSLSGANTFSGAIAVNGGTLAFTQTGINTYGAISGVGAVTQAGTGTTILTGTDTYSGLTTLTAGVLQLNNADALPGGIGDIGGTSALTFSGGVLGLGAGNFTRNLGAAGLVTAANFTGAGGWAAYGADRTVNLGGSSATISWATANSGFNNQTLILGASTATHTLDLQNPLDLGTAARTVQVENGSGAIDGQLSGLLSGGAGGGITKTGLGTLALSNASNSYTGTTAISAGTLVISGTGTLGNGAGLTLGGGALDLGTTSQTVGAVSITAAAASGDTIKNGSLTGTSYAASLTSGNALVSANLLANGGAGFAKSGTGMVTLSGTNTYAGGTNITGGFLQFNSPAAIGGSARDVTVTSPGTVLFGPAFGTIQGSLTGRVVATSTGVIAADNHGSETLDFSSAGANFNAAYLGAFGTVTYTGALTPNGTTYRLGGGGGTLTMANTNALTGTGYSLVVNGNVTLAASNNYDNGTMLTAGTLAVGSDTSLGSGTLTFNGGTIRSATSSARTLANPIALSNNVTVGGTGNMTFSDTSATALGATRTFTINNPTSTFAQAFSGATFGITKAGAGTLVLTGSNTYTGATTINGGVVRANDGVGLPSGVGGSYLNLNGGVFETSANLERAGGTGQGQMQITGGTSGFSANGGPVQVAFGTLAAPTALTWGTAPFQPGTLVLNAPTANNTLEFKNDVSLANSGRTIEVDANVATMSGTVSSTGTSGSLTKIGLGTLVLNKATYTGSTTVHGGGTLRVNGATSTLSATAGLLLGVNNTEYKGGSAFIYDNVGATGTTSQTMASLASQNSQPNDNTVQVNRTAAQPVSLTFTSVTGNSSENGNVINFVTNNVAGGGTNGTDYKIVLGSGTSATQGSGGNAYQTIVSQNAYFNGGDFAVYDISGGTGLSGFVRGIKYGTDANSLTFAAGPITTTNNAQITGDITGQNSVTLGGTASGTNGTLKINGAFSLTMNAGQTLTLQGSGNSGIDGILKTGGGTSVISGGTAVSLTNTQGDIRVDGATDVLDIAMPLTFGAATRLMKSGAGTLIVSNGTLSLTDSRNTLYINDGVFEIGGNATLNDTAGPIRFATGAVLKHNSSSLTSVIATGITGAGSVAVNAGTLTLSAGNSYTGTTTVSGGTLAIGTAGSLANTTVTVGGSGTLAGAGTIGGSTTIQGIHTPGFSAGLQTFSNGLAYAATSKLSWELSANTATGRGTNFDGVNVTGGTFAIASGATLDLTFGGAVNFADSFWNAAHTWTVADLGLAVTDSGSDLFTLGSITGGSYSPAEGSFSVTRVDPGDGKNDVVLNWSAVAVTDAYLNWIQGITPAIPLVDQDPQDDPDKDGATNLEEFAFGGIPNDPAKRGLVFGFEADSDAPGDPSSAKEMILTVAVRTGAAFSTPGAPAVSNATVDGLNYSIYGSTDLTDWTVTVTPTATVVNPDNVLPALPANYVYKSFSLSGSDGLPGKGFLRAGVVRP